MRTREVGIYNYWKVSTNNIKFMPGIRENEVRCWSDLCYESGGYIYICTFKSFDHNIIRCGYMPYAIESVEYFSTSNYIYMGEFNGRKKKLEKLNIIYNESNM